MLKKIAVDQLEVGMYIDKVCGSWLESPFWQKNFQLQSHADLQRVRASSIREVWIDTSKTIVMAHAAAVSEGSDDEEEEEAQDADGAAASAPSPSPAAKSAPAPRPLSEIPPASMAQEIQHAARLLKKSREAVESMFSEARMGKAVAVGDAMPLVEEITQSVVRNSGAMVGLARLKTADDYTYMHSVAVCALMIALARQAGLSDEEVRQAGLAGLLHDIGKMAIPPAILKKPGKLTDQEFQIVKSHPAAGYKILQGSPGMVAMALDVCLHHHEKFDGSGYPDGLKGEQISLYARMGAICDVYDAITSNRPYKPGWCPAESLRRMAEWSKSHFDERLFGAFVKCIGIYPVGTLVRFKSERMGVVVEQSAKSLTNPKVRVFFSAKSRSYLRPELVDLASPACSDTIVSREDAAQWGLKDVHHYWSGETTFA